MENRIPLTIAGLTLLVTTDEDRDYVNQLADQIDRDVYAVLNSSAHASVTHAALLCAVDYYDKYQKATRSANNLRSEIKNYLSDAESLRALVSARDDDIHELRAQLESGAQPANLSEQNTALQTRVTQLEQRNEELAKVEAERDSLLASMAQLQAQLIVDSQQNGAAEQQHRADELQQSNEQLADRLAASEKETQRLQRELDTLEQMITEDGGAKSPGADNETALSEPAPVEPAAPQLPPADDVPVRDDNAVAVQSGLEDYMPDLRWIDELNKN